LMELSEKIGQGPELTLGSGIVSKGHDKPASGDDLAYKSTLVL
jgi:hypothetical protein